MEDIVTPEQSSPEWRGILGMENGTEERDGGSETELIVVLQRAGFFLIHTAHEERTRLQAPGARSRAN